MEQEHWLEEHKTTKKLLTLGSINNENSHRGNHLYTKHSITQLPVAPCAGHLIQTKKQDKNTNSIISRQDYHLTQLCPSKEKTKQNVPPPTRMQAQITPYTKLTKTTWPNFNQFNSVTQSYPTLCDPIDCSMPGFPVHHNSWSLLKVMSI